MMGQIDLLRIFNEDNILAGNLPLTVIDDMRIIGASLKDERHTERRWKFSLLTFFGRYVQDNFGEESIQTVEVTQAQEVKLWKTGSAWTPRSVAESRVSAGLASW